MNWRMIGLLGLGVATLSNAQVIERLADIETGAGPNSSSFPAGFSNINSAALGDGRVLFAASNPESGRELWVSTGASAVLVKDIEPGSASSAPDRLVAFDGRVWFTAITSDHGRELWVSDGSPAGTHIAVELVPGLAGSAAEPLIAINGTQLLVSAIDAQGQGMFAVSPTGVATRLAALSYCALPGLSQRLVVVGTLVFFAASDANGCEPFVSDGTPAGTFALGDLAAGSANSSPQRFTAVGSQAFFTATSTATGRELWVSDGSAAGTRPVADFAPGATGADPLGLIEYNGRLVFVARDAGASRRLRSTDGNVIDTIEPSAGFVAGNETVRFGNEVCFAGNDGTTGNELWCSDGSGAGTRRVRDLFVGAGSSTPGNFLVANTALGSRLFYTSTNSADSVTRLAISDGSSGGTFILNPTGGFSSIFFAAVGGQALARNSDASGDVELWRSDGSALGTSRLADIGSAPGSSLMSRIVPSASHSIGYFAAFRSTTGYELWRTNGTASGTQQVIDLAPGPTSGVPLELLASFSDPVRSAAFGERLLFVGNDGGSGEEPWISDGTAAGTIKLADTLAGNNGTGTGPQHFAALGQHAYFLARISTGQSFMKRLFRTDGTAAGTVELSVPANLTKLIGPWIAAGGTLFIAVERATEGEELWRINAAGDALELVADLAPGTASTQLRGGVALGEQLVFAAAQQGRGVELFVSDGSAAGTLPLPDIAVGFPGSLVQLSPEPQSNARARNTVVFGSRMFYSCDPDGVQTNIEPCVSDGTAAGTGRLLDYEPGNAGSNPVEPISNGTNVWFIATKGGERGVHVTDGSVAGTSSVIETLGIAPEALTLLPNGELVMSGNLTLGASDFGRELFAGTPGSIRGFNLAASELSSTPANLVRIGDAVVFSANTGSAGNEPHVYRSEVIFADAFE
jgi:ELWxxDGT repeat protein